MSVVRGPWRQGEKGEQGEKSGKGGGQGVYVERKFFPTFWFALNCFKVLYLHAYA